MVKNHHLSIPYHLFFRIFRGEDSGKAAAWEEKVGIAKVKARPTLGLPLTQCIMNYNDISYIIIFNGYLWLVLYIYIFISSFRCLIIFTICIYNMYNTFLNVFWCIYIYIYVYVYVYTPAKSTCSEFQPLSEGYAVTRREYI